MKSWQRGRYSVLNRAIRSWTVSLGLRRPGGGVYDLGEVLLELLLLFGEAKIVEVGRFAVDDDVAVGVGNAVREGVDVLLVGRYVGS